MMGGCRSANTDKAAIKSAKVSVTTCRSCVSAFALEYEIGSLYSQTKSES